MTPPQEPEAELAALREAMPCPACHHLDHDPGSCPDCPRCELHVDEALIWLSRVARAEYDEFVEGIEHAATLRAAAHRPVALDVERLEQAMRAWYGRQGDGDHPRTWIDEDAPGIAAEYAALSGEPAEEGLRETLVEAGRYIASLGGEESRIVSARIAVALAKEPSDGA